MKTLKLPHVGRAWLAGGAATIAAVAVMTWAFMPRPVEVEVAVAATGRFEAAVEEDAKTRLRDRYVVSAPLAGQLARIALREGDAVAAGAVVAQLTPVLSPMLDERTRREQQARLEVTEAQLQRASARAEGARVALLQARNDAQRSEQLAKQGFVSPTRLESDRLAALAAQQELDAATGDQHAAGHEVEQARAALGAVRNAPAGAPRAFAVRSPVSARVLRVAQASEATVALGAPLLELGDVAGLEVVAELLTADALQVHTGAPVAIEHWGGETALRGRVRLVEPGAFTKVSALGVEEQRVRVLVDIASPPADWSALGDGYRVTVRVLTMAKDGVTKVPVSAVFPLPSSMGGPGARMGVFVVDGGRARLTPVVIGARNPTEAWVREGLPVGARVIVYPPSAVGDGVRVKVRTV
ncbi:HlyD family efflux transporter periplasmic adaptor subunit [Rhizobacter sp. SG703]|uniref:efflux RND transporter periplasmic adaptor subunit n=1 Tax=Rhizobacter sp. SG703 TaxID=2587140 RepID=UPI0014475B18|nr:HlyD family efflux transporter periplasmic adaptor subunit [Rhizobacter sp. SG703]NKI94171.1 HlyD family secretion protein [Rhizobacter sp. SG703]